MFSTMPSTGTRTFAEHRQALAGVDQATSCGVVTMTAPGQRDRLRQRQLGVAGAGRQIETREIELAPVESRQESADGVARHHRPAPDHGLSASTRKPIDISLRP